MKLVSDIPQAKIDDLLDAELKKFKTKAALNGLQINILEELAFKQGYLYSVQRAMSGLRKMADILSGDADLD